MEEADPGLSDRWLAANDPTWEKPKASRDIPAGGTTDEYDEDSEDGASVTPSFMWLFDNAQPWIGRDVLDQDYRDTHKEERQAYNRDYRKRAAAQPNRIEGKTWHSGMWRTPEQIEQHRVDSLRRYHANKEAINARKRAARAAKKTQS